MTHRQAKQNSKHFNQLPLDPLLAGLVEFATIQELSNRIYQLYQVSSPGEEEEERDEEQPGWMGSVAGRMLVGDREREVEK